MKNIAIFVSGNGEAAERIVRLFNDGNRVHTSLVIVDDTAVELPGRLNAEGLETLHIPDADWHSRSGEVARLLKENEIRLIVLDNFDLAISDEIMEATQGEIVRVSSPEQAPREVVNALEAELRKPVEEIVVETPEEEEKTPESEWAEALNIRYTPPKVPNTPPDVPETPDSQNPQFQNNPQYQNNYGGESPRFWQNPYYQQSRRPENHENSEPMPSTWLIWSVLITVFCCFIPGIIAIIYSSQVSSRYYAGDIEGARRASRNAEIWIIVSFVLGVLSATLYLPFMLIG